MEQEKECDHKWINAQDNNCDSWRFCLKCHKEVAFDEHLRTIPSCQVCSACMGKGCRICHPGYVGQPKPVVPSVEEMEIIAVEAMNKESIRNGNTGMKHEFSQYCSCGVCHTATIIVEAIHEAMKGESKSA